MTVEEQVRQALTDERHALPGWPDPIGRVSIGIRQRRRRRAVVTGLAVAIVAAVGVPVALRSAGGGAPGDEMPANGVIGWVDAPVPRPTHLARREPRPDARECTPADLGVTPGARSPVAWVEPGGEGDEGDGHQRLTVLLANSRDSRCTLRGSVELVATDASTGRRGALATWSEPPKADGVNQYPATIDPGEPARVDLVTSARCAGAAPSPRRYRDVALVTLGQEIAISGLDLPIGCPLGVGSWYVLPPLLNVPDQVVSIEAPERVRRGDTLEYVVTVLNSSDRPFPLRPCPVYAQRLGAEATTHRLNCAVRAIAGHTSVRFRMRLAVPETVPLGTNRLSWMAVMDDGRVAIANLATGGVEIEVTG